MSDEQRECAGDCEQPLEYYVRTFKVVRDEIERLCTENERLKGALVRISDYKAKEYKQAARGHYCPYRSAIDGLQSIASHALSRDGER